MEKDFLPEIREKIKLIRQQLDDLERLLDGEVDENQAVKVDSSMPDFWVTPAAQKEEEDKAFIGDDEAPEVVEDETIVESWEKPIREILQEEEVTTPKETSVLDNLTEKCRWRFEQPRIKVGNIRSAISLMDRALFIKELFKGDSEKYMTTIKQLNEMENFDNAVEMLYSEFPSWDVESDTVYRFMMAIRSKLG